MGGRTSQSHTDALITGVAGAYAMIHAVTASVIHGFPVSRPYKRGEP